MLSPLRHSLSLSHTHPQTHTHAHMHTHTCWSGTGPNQRQVSAQSSGVHQVNARDALRGKPISIMEFYPQSAYWNIMLLRLTIFLQMIREGHRQSDEHWNCFKGNSGDISERQGRAHMGFSKRIDTILNRTTLLWVRQLQLKKLHVLKLMSHY